MSTMVTINENVVILLAGVALLLPVVSAYMATKITSGPRGWERAPGMWLLLAVMAVVGLVCVIVGLGHGFYLGVTQ